MHMSGWESNLNRTHHRRTEEDQIENKDPELLCHIVILTNRPAFKQCLQKTCRVQGAPQTTREGPPFTLPKRLECVRLDPQSHCHSNDCRLHHIAMTRPLEC